VLTVSLIISCILQQAGVEQQPRNLMRRWTSCALGFFCTCDVSITSTMQLRVFSLCRGNSRFDSFSSLIHIHIAVSDLLLKFIVICFSSIAGIGSNEDIYR
jgi:hypothetical protein